jgi:pimeloyl-ACP methyl ester carboxylesterase
VTAAVATFEAALPHGITLTCREVGRGRGPRVLLLHGFPEGAFVWDPVLGALADEANAVAPDLRGYGRSSAPAAVEAYRARHLVGDLVALIERMGAPVDVLVGHDWGGALAWSLAAQRPDLLHRLLIINSPHPAAFLRELRDNPAQQAASAYMNFLCRPDAAALLAENDFARLWPFFERMGGHTWLDAPMRERYRAHWRQGLDGALNYYRASPLRPPVSPDDPIHHLQLPAEAITVHVPTTVLWGEADSALPPALLDGLETWVPRLQVQRVPQATHWILHEQPQRVITLVRQLLRDARGTA